MLTEEVMIHVDFSENYNTKYESEIQSMHSGASRRQISLHTGVAYIWADVYPFCTHGPAAIWAHMEPVIRYIQNIKAISGIHFLTDGPTTQYRNKTFITFISGLIRFLTTALKASHGKSASDGKGAAIKRAADHQVNVRGRDISCAAELVATVQPSSSVKLFIVEESSIDAIEGILPIALNSIPGTMKLHQLNTLRRGEISCRVMSCFCSHPTLCDCFEPLTIQFPNPVTREPNNPDEDDQHITGHGTHTSIPDTQQQMSLTQNSPQLLKSTCVDETLIVGVDENDLDVKVMHKVGNNRYFWPLIDDQCWYTQDKVVTLLDQEPEHVTFRHCQIPTIVWELIKKEMDI
ncbi:hypothetical protein MAR_027242 [Mya arenaria]|uniref:Uncharacterized protein n=1 Tax=Mya arenaria TaxID=6604 RepID=A0ABY7EVX8_MYAAR|nr:hypothetical protein MAR_027242 [Mya arenaria]